MLLSASVNSISSIPSPVYQCKKALRLNMAVNCSLTRLNISWIEVEFPTNVDAIFNPSASLSRTIHSSAFSTNWCTESVALYGSTTVSDTLGEGKTENVSIILSGYSSLIFEIKSVPMPEPVPPPREWQT
ncbi:hypothetical protein Ccrd_007579 [Cynara cardunculus var. scolymus]|uniref:Uncharacterized protein n=1 Tax=Cynara cardunculus var. scolymus TaxID=59895 RepID=A0A103XGM9_CYNCS|nr:hypothetical protein Ccrd_007579 [Cynara cardunculus var. scolymus]